MQQKPFSVILSDMCPLVSGITTRDAALSVELGMQALDLDCILESEDVKGWIVFYLLYLIWLLVEQHYILWMIMFRRKKRWSAMVMLTGVFMDGKRFQNWRVSSPAPVTIV